MKLKTLTRTQTTILLLIASLPLSLSADPAQPAPPRPGQSWMADPKIDPQLKEICKTTKDPEMCLQWYFVSTGEDKPDPTVNKRAVLRKELEVGKKMSLEFYTLAINRSAEQYGKDEKGYGLYDACAKNYVVAANEYIAAKEALLKDNDLEKCKNAIRGAVGQYRTCDDAFAGAPKMDTARLYTLGDVCLDLATSL